MSGKKGEVKNMSEVSNETRLVIKLLNERAKAWKEGAKGIARTIKKKEVTATTEAHCDGILWAENELDKIVQELCQGR